jgi:flagellar protein FlaG
LGAAGIIISFLSRFKEGMLMDIDAVGARFDPAVYPLRNDKRKDTTAARALPGTTSSQTEVGPQFLHEAPFLNDAIDKLKKAGDIFNRRLEFKVDEDTHRIMVKVIDTETDKVIKEIPPEQIIELAAKIQEMVGLLVDEER